MRRLLIVLALVAALVLGATSAEARHHRHAPASGWTQIPLPDGALD